MKFIEKEKKNILFCLISTFIIGFIAHGYMFFSNAISHDSLNEFVYNSAWKNSLGRIFAPIFVKVVRGDVIIPFFIGLLGLLFIGLSVYLVAKTFNIKNEKLIVLISCIMTVNVSNTATIATYLGDFDVNMLGLFFACLAVYLCTQYKKGYLYGIIPVCLCIGFYQSLISITISLLIIYYVIELINGKNNKVVLINGLKSILMIILGSVLYFITLKVYLLILGVSLNSGGYNSLTNISDLSLKGIIVSVYDTYLVTIKDIVMPSMTLPNKISLIITFMFYIVPFILFLKNYLFNKKYNLVNKIYVIILLAILPIGMNISRILCGNMSHDLMHYAFIFSYLFVIMVIGWFIDNKYLNNKMLKYLPTYIVILLSIITMYNIKTSNTVYLLKDYTKEANIAYYTRVLDDIEKNEDYNSDTEVLFVGRPKAIEVDKYFNCVNDITGANQNGHALGSALPSYYQNYFKYVMLNPIKILAREKSDELINNKKVIDMPAYPEKGSIQLIDGVLVVKQG